jgi:hypothetical protein
VSGVGQGKGINTSGNDTGGLALWLVLLAASEDHRRITML